MKSTYTSRLAAYIKEKGIKIAKISEATGIPYFNLYDSLSRGHSKRDLRVEEFMAVCSFLEKDPNDFSEK